MREQSSQYHRDFPFSTEEIQVNGGLADSTTVPQNEQVTTSPH
ncbi:MAG: hypothetical protein ABIR34_06130 [Marmoricola sp.]